MSDEDNFFAMPPSDPPVYGDDDDNNAPILLGEAPPQDSDFTMVPDHAAYLGEVDEAPPVMVEDDTPIILGGAGVEDVPMPAEEIVPAEPSPMQKWNAEWQETLIQRKEEENARKAELVEAARVALEEFQQQREAKREAAMSKNRQDEQDKLEAIEADLENDNSWQRVCKMIELSHDSTAKAQDVKRMREILILLKNETALAQQLGA